MMWLLLGCQQETIRVFAQEDQMEAITFFIQSIGDERLDVVQSSNPSRSARRYNGWSVALELNEESIAALQNGSSKCSNFSSESLYFIERRVVSSP